MALPRSYQRDCWLGALSAALMLIGDLCLSVIPAIPGDSGLLLRQAYLNGSYPAWRLPLLLATGLAGMALAFFSVRARYMQIKPQYRKMRRAHRRHDLHSHGCRAECSAFTRSCGRSFL